MNGRVVKGKYDHVRERVRERARGFLANVCGSGSC